MAYASISTQWTPTNLDEEGTMDITSDRSGDHNDKGFLRPLPRSVPDDGVSMRSFGDEDMIDLSPRPSPRPSPGLHPQEEVLDPMGTLEADSIDAHQPTALNDLDEITFDDDTYDDKHQPFGDDRIENTSHDVSNDLGLGADTPQLCHLATEGKYPDLIDYGDEDDDADTLSGDPAVANERPTTNIDIVDQPVKVPQELETNVSEAVDGDSIAELAEEDHDNPAEHESKEAATNDPAKGASGPQEKYSSHPVVIDYYDQWISLFNGSLPDIKDCFEADEEVLYGNLSLIFDHFRKSRFIEVNEWEYLEVHVPALDLWVREKTTAADQYALADLLNTYLDLHSQDGNYAPNPLFVTLTVRPVFKFQLEKLQKVAANGEGFSKCDFLKSHQTEFRPSEDGSGEEDNDLSQQPHEEYQDGNDLENPHDNEADPGDYASESANMTGQPMFPAADQQLSADGNFDQDFEGHVEGEDFGDPYDEHSYDQGEIVHDQLLADDIEKTTATLGQLPEDNADVQSNFHNGIEEQAAYGEEEFAQEGPGTFTALNASYNENEVGEGEGEYDGDFTNNGDDTFEDVEQGQDDDEDDDQDESQNEGQDDGQQTFREPKTEAEDAKSGTLTVSEADHTFGQELDQIADGQDHDVDQTNYEDSFLNEDEGEGDDSIGSGNGGFDDSYGYYPEGQSNVEETDAGLSAEVSYDLHETEVVATSLEADNTGGAHEAGFAQLDPSSLVEGDFLIDYSDDEGVDEENTVSQIPDQLHQGVASLAPAQDGEDDINYTDDEDSARTKTPTKRTRSDDDQGTEAKRHRPSE